MVNLLVLHRNLYGSLWHKVHETNGQMDLVQWQVKAGIGNIGPARGHIKKEVVLRKSRPVAQNAGPSYKKTIPIIFS